MDARQAARRPCSIGWLRLKAEVTWMPDRPRADPAASGGSALRRKSHGCPTGRAPTLQHRVAPPEGGSHMDARQAARRPCSIGWLRLEAEVTWMPDRPRADAAASG